MRGWPILLGGLAIWAAHFFAIYALGEFVIDTLLTRIAIGALTLVALAAQLVLLARLRRTSGDGFERWQVEVGTLGAVIGAIGVLWQSLPALF